MLNSRLIVKDRSALIAIFFLYLYGILLPFTILLGNQIAIMIFTFLLLVYSIIHKVIHLNIKILLLIIIPFFLLVVKLPFEPHVENVNIGLEMLISFLTIGLSGILLGTVRFSNTKFLYYGYVLGWINFAAVFMVPFMFRDDINYMRFGYSLLPTIFFSFVFLFGKDKKIGAMILFSLSLFELFIFGARGAMLSFLLFAFIYMFFIPVIKLKFKLFLLFLLTLITTALPSILKYLFRILSQHGYESYALTKYLNYFNGQSFSSTASGRTAIYELAFKRMWEHPILGSPINTCFIDTGSSYYHNIFIDIAVNFGFIALFLFVFFLFFYACKALLSKDADFKIVFFIIFIIPIGRLFVSSSFWQRPDFWFFISYCISVFSKKNRIIAL